MLATVGKSYPARSARSGTVLRARAQVYEAAGTSRRARRWQAPTIGPNDSVLGSLSLLRDRSRAADRNDGWAWSAINKLVTNIVGCGITPLSKSPDPDFRKALHTKFLSWTDFSDADGLLEYYGQQGQAVYTWLSAGECFIRMRDRLPGDGLPVPLQLQLIEPEFCPHTHHGVNGANRIRAGIEFSPIGKRVAYWMYRQRPGDLQDLDVSQLVRVPAETVIHLFDPARPGQIRGIPRLTRALVRFLDLDRFDDATLLRQQIANLFAAFVTPPAGTADAELDPLTGHPVESLGDQAVVGLEPGIVQRLDPGESIEFAKPPDVGNTYGDFMRQQLMGAAVATGVPYEVMTGDMSKVNDRTVRVILGEFRRYVQQMQHFIVAFQLCQRVWSAWFDRALLSGALDVPSAYYDDPLTWRAVEWQPHGWPYIHPLQDVEAQLKAIAGGLNSRSGSAAESGRSAETIDEEQAADRERERRLGLTYNAAAATPANPLTEDPRDPNSRDGEE